MPAPPVEAAATPTGRLTTVVDGFFRQHSLPPGPGLVAFSGGPDSAALLTVLAARARRAGAVLHAAHLDHGLDPGSADRASAAGRLAAAAGVELHSERREVPALRRPGESLEAAARRVRDAFLAETARRLGATWVATAHHRDDQAETVLLRLAQGSGWRGLAGIRPVRRLAGGVLLVRPVLELGRADLATARVSAETSAVEDPTNRDLSLTRNRIRHILLPLLSTKEDAALEPPTTPSHDAPSPSPPSRYAVVPPSPTTGAGGVEHPAPGALERAPGRADGSPTPMERPRKAGPSPSQSPFERGPVPERGAPRPLTPPVAVPHAHSASHARLTRRLAAVATTARAAREAVDRRLAAHLAPRPLDGGLAVPRHALASLPEPLLPAALALLHRGAGAPHPAGRDARRELARQLAAPGAAVGCDCGGGWRWEDRGELLALLPPADAAARRSPSPSFSYTLTVPGELELPELGCRMTLRREPPAPWMVRGAPHRAALALPLADGDRVTVRSRRPGDRLRPLGAGGSRRLKEVLIDRRVPRGERDRLPLLCLGAAGGTIAWVPGVTIDERFRLPEPRSGAAPAGVPPSVWVAEITRLPDRGTAQPSTET